MPRGGSRAGTGGAGRRDSVRRRSADRPATTQRIPRVKRAREIAHLRDAQGLSFREIARRLGLAVSTAQIYYADPSGDRQRRRRKDYRGTCRSCGRQTSGAQGPRKAPAYCAECARRRRRTWSEQEIVAAVRDWYAIIGTPPTVPDWSPAHAPAGHEGASRYRSEPGRWPSAALVARRFGSFPDAVRHAGLEPAPPAPRRRWTEERIVAAIKSWVNRTGAPPTRTQWSRAGRGHPAASTVYRVIGLWRRALAEAGALRAPSTTNPVRRRRTRQST
jgi:Homing endonuclease associated repeat